MESSQWENWNHLFCRKVSFLTDQHRCCNHQDFRPPSSLVSNTRQMCYLIQYVVYDKKEVMLAYSLYPGSIKALTMCKWHHGGHFVLVEEYQETTSYLEQVLSELYHKVISSSPNTCLIYRNRTYHNRPGLTLRQNKHVLRASGGKGHHKIRSSGNLFFISQIVGSKTHQI